MIYSKRARAWTQEEEGFRRSSELGVVVNILWYLTEMTSNLALHAFTSYGTDTTEYDTTELQLVLMIYGLRSGAGLEHRYAG